MSIFEFLNTVTTDIVTENKKSMFAPREFFVEFTHRGTSIDVRLLSLKYPRFPTREYKLHCSCQEARKFWNTFLKELPDQTTLSEFAIVPYEYLREATYQVV